MSKCVSLARYRDHVVERVSDDPDRKTRFPTATGAAERTVAVG